MYAFFTTIEAQSHSSWVYRVLAANFFNGLEKILSVILVVAGGVRNPGYPRPCSCAPDDKERKMGKTGGAGGWGEVARPVCGSA